MGDHVDPQGLFEVEDLKAEPTHILEILVNHVDMFH
jgi:hypothetical protein